MVFLQGRNEMGLEVGRKGICTGQSLSGPGDLSGGHLEPQAPPESASVWQEN